MPWSYSTRASLATISSIHPCISSCLGVDPVAITFNPCHAELISVDIKFVNPLCAKLFRGNKNIYLHYMSFLHIDMTQVVEILP